jgi:hypothetical protein
VTEGSFIWEYTIADEVRIIAINTIARVDGLTLDNSGPMYRVVYWDNSERRSVWVYPWEIKAAKSVTE